MTDHGLGCDTIVALPSATANGQVLFGKNSDRPSGERQRLVRVEGRPHALDELVQTQYIPLPQVRQTYTVIGSQPEGLWGFEHGVNEHQLCIGNEALHNKLALDRPGLIGMDLVRLVLERCRTAPQAVDLLTNLIQEHGQGSFAGCLPQADYDNAFLIADPNEAVVLEAAACHWVVQEVREVRAASNITSVRQDWDRISPGLATHAITEGWWPGDGSKLDFAGAVANSPTGYLSALRRWGRATLLLEQQNGHIDHYFFRQVLTDHYETDPTRRRVPRGWENPKPICMHGATITAASIIAQLSTDPDRLPIIWCAFGPPCLSVYLPLLLEGDLPAGLTTFDGLARRVNELAENSEKSALDRFAELQVRLDEDAESFAGEGAALRGQGKLAELSRQASLFMEHVVERFEDSVERVARPARLVGV